MVVETICAASLYPSRAVDDTAAQQDRTARDEGAIPAVNCVALRCRMPHLPLLPLWEKGAGGDKGQKRVGTNWSSLWCEARLRRRERMIYSKTIEWDRRENGRIETA
jgi:hypothetical protein